MAKRKQYPPLTVKAYVSVNGVETDVDTLNAEQKQRLARWMRLTMLNTVYQGKYVFRGPDEEPGGGQGNPAEAETGGEEARA